MNLFTERAPTKSLVAACAALAVLASGCANMSDAQRHTAIGAGVGALAGVAIGDSKKSAAVGAGLGALGGYVWSRQMADKKAVMEQATRGTGVDVVQTADNQLKLNIPSDVSFDSGRAEIRAGLRPVLDAFAQGLGNQPNMDVRVVGHTDSTGGDAINNPLSVNRAAAVRDYLTSRGVDGRRVQIDGRGSREPVTDNRTDAGRAANRRVEIFLAERQQ
ncbi:MAG: OmpA family protein [Burkholderiaceae bacterium]|nr:OmpA family protein [Burkholderiaceae bacterium]MDZ4161079.1 OmpA family protein [Burkholderiales bacterium]